MSEEMSMKKFLLSACAALVCALPVAMGTQPNIILVLVDDLGWGDMNLPQGTPKVEGTPRIDMPRLAEMAQTGLITLFSLLCRHIANHLDIVAIDTQFGDIVGI